MISGYNFLYENVIHAYYSSRHILSFHENTSIFKSLCKRLACGLCTGCKLSSCLAKSDYPVGYQSCLVTVEAKNCKQDSPLEMGPGRVSFQTANLTFELDFNIIPKNVQLNIEAVSSIAAIIAFKYHHEIEKSSSFLSTSIY